MFRASTVTGCILLAVGVGGFAAAGFSKSAITALIPAIFGILILLCAAWGRRPGQRTNATATAAVVAFLGVLVPGGRLVMVFSEGDTPWDLKTGSLLVMSVVCLALFLLCLRLLMSRRQRGA
jgi:hypothetical protein